MDGYCNQNEVVRRTDEAIERREWLDGIRRDPPQPQPVKPCFALQSIALFNSVFQHFEHKPSEATHG